VSNREFKGNKYTHLGP